ncbi:MltA domain-containing protein [Spirulina subsalsa FACHB-351]|uniref:peptidoglycan lytic exotransglycosylase n=1 Tax=Spirulina subsalsa FACHB-351 TaxID=234711 RepID=A0ABT3L7T3_9CYAN|nr:MltA domain-containing protein [Spirulina subsalsa]MCW6037571.1 MltA domain-containing protein [Spirulina subsalsa FACHB-351]
MKKTLTLFALGLGLAMGMPQVPLQAQQAPLTWSNPHRQAPNLALDEQLWGSLGQPGDKQALIRSIDHSLRYLDTPAAARAYQNYPIRWITRDRVRRSLQRFRHLVLTSNSPQELQAAVKREFVFYKSIGSPRYGGQVFFTGYYEPTYPASRVRTPEYRYPLYRRPSSLESWKAPHPSRAQLEGADGTGKDSILAGYELVWLRDRLQAFLVQVQGSARLQLTDGSTMTVGFHGSTDYPYVSVGQEMIKDGLHPADGFTLPKMINIFQQNPDLLNVYIPRNNRFIFFRETHGAPATGSISVPVTPDRSIATDKSLMPPGALALIHTRIPFPDGQGGMITPEVSRFVLDQDTGSAIRTPGRVDVFMGTGPVAGDRAGVMGYRGALYYLMLKE